MQIESISDVWNAVCEECRKYITDVGFNVWIKDLKPVQMLPGEFVVSIYSEYKKQIIEMNYTKIRETCLSEVMGVPMKIRVVLTKEDEIIEETVNPENTSF